MNDDGVKVMRNVACGAGDEGASVTMQHPEFGEILKLSCGKVVVPLNSCLDAIASRMADAAARIEQLERQLWNEEADRASLIAQRDAALARLPEGDPLADAHQHCVVQDSQAKIEQLNEVHKVLADCLEAINPIADKIEDGVSVVVSTGNEHGQAILEASEVVGEYTDRHLD